MVSRTFFSELTTEFTTARTVGFGLTGSHARGDAVAHSDVDLLHFFQTLPENEYQHGQLLLRETVLISVSTVTTADKRAEMQMPQEAIFAVPGLRQMQILYDPRGELARLKDEAVAFTWTDALQAAADAYTSYQLMGCAEEVHKIVNGLYMQNATMLLHASLGLWLNMARTLAVQRGVMIESENKYFDVVQASAGTESEWSRAFRDAAGLGTAPLNVMERSRAALRLYRETFKMTRHVVRREHEAVVKRAMEIMDLPHP